jgi:hypothetical protein
MKELSIEEKARAYDEVTKKVNDYYEGKTKIYSDVDKTLNYLFPELKESEDDRIKKELIEYFKWNTEQILDNFDNKDVLAWLEKHSEQKTIDEIAKEVCKNKESAMAFLKSAGIMNEKGELADEYKIEQGEQNPEEADNLHNYLYGEREATWSEEDNINCKRLLYFLDGGHLMHDHNIELSIWLKSLKERYTWKPSEEQIEILDMVLTNESMDDNIARILRELREQLKKLKS